MLTTDDIKETVQGKIIHICGNGTDRHPKIKDSILVRINKGIKLGDCDVWINNLIHLGINERHKNKAKIIMRLNAELNGQRLRSCTDNLDQDKLYIWNVKEWEEAAEEIGERKDFRPLSGTLAVYWFLKHTEPKEILLSGFDFFTHGDKRAAKLHYPDTDRKWIRQQKNVHRLTKSYSYLKDTM